MRSTHEDHDGTHEEVGEPVRASGSAHSGHGSGGPYARLAAMAALSFAAMYGLMYAMVDSVLRLGVVMLHRPDLPSS